MERRRIPLALLVALPAVGLGLFGLWTNGRALADPCVAWPGGATPSSDACESFRFMSEPRGRFALATLPFMGLVLAAGAALCVGMLLARPAWTVAGAAILLVAGIPLALGGYGLALCWISAALAMVATRLLDGFGDAQTPARLVGALSLAGVAYVVLALARGGAPLGFGLVALAPLVAVGAASLWPRKA